MLKQARRRKYVSGAEKIHTSIYLLPRHRAHIERLMRSRGKTMNECICDMIDQSIRKVTGKSNG